MTAKALEALTPFGTGVFNREALATVLRGAVPSCVVGAHAKKAAKHRAGLRKRLATYLGSVPATA